MTSKTYATLNRNAKDEFLLLSQGDQIVTTVGANLTGEHMVLGTIPKAVGHVYFECYFWSVSRGNLAGLASVGVAALDAELNKYVGQADNTWGFRPFDGGIWNNDAQVVAGPVIPERSCIGVYVNFNASPSPLLAFFVSGSLHREIYLPNDSGGNDFIVAAISLGSGADVAAGDISAFVNFGQRTMDTNPQGTIS